jgi:hypothetical protein
MNNCVVTEITTVQPGTFDASHEGMGLRAFIGTDGVQWKVWLVRAGSAGTMLGMPAEWLTFQNDSDTERRRLLDIPADWETISDARLDVLRRCAEPVTLYSHRFSPADGMDRISFRLTDQHE